MKGSVASKQFGLEDILCPLIAKACIEVCPENPRNFGVDNVRVAKLQGGGISDSYVVKGIVLKRNVENSITSASDAKVAVFSQGVDLASTDTKGTVLLKSAEELEGYSRTEEDRMEQIIKDIAETGAKVVVSGSAVSDMALHFCTRYNLMVVRIQSKFEMRRLCKATGSIAMPKLQVTRPPMEETPRQGETMSPPPPLPSSPSPSSSYSTFSTMLLLLLLLRPLPPPSSSPVSSFPPLVLFLLPLPPPLPSASPHLLLPLLFLFFVPFCQPSSPSLVLLPFPCPPPPPPFLFPCFPFPATPCF